LLANFRQDAYGYSMRIMTISLPDSLKSFVDAQARQRGYRTGSEYVRELIQKNHDQQHLRDLLLKGAGSKPAPTADKAYFKSLRDRIRSGP
jgi:antitoxin ParD1/3/4